ncbi:MULTISPECIES: hypothetical protein [Sphingobium]|uniref:Uncharacterized protein n=1 Tax=Sphingobium tyrosinilyticum TaxID=2715436 RepID=A0ABV9EZX5_9SPHN|nr:hypothetical protein [Sphingobium sp. EP60837]ANI77169.1 hypothetical protein EP837_00730 [Sphingobium sp. EP60837]
MLLIHQGMAQTELIRTLIAAGAQTILIGLPPEMAAEALQVAASSIHERGHDLEWCATRAAHLGRAAGPKQANDG